MITWHIAAHGCYEATAGEAAAPLIDELRVELADPPRRINRYTRLALLGAHRCVAGYAGTLAPSTPLYLASEHGNVAETVTMMEDLLMRGLPPKPMSFVNLSSNMAGFYLAASLGLTGRNMAVARYQGGFGAMLELASLDPLRCGPLLLGTVVEAVWPLHEHRRRCALAPEVPLVEGSYWLIAQQTPQAGPGLGFQTTTTLEQARAWLAAGERWFIDPQLAPGQRRRLSQGLAANRRMPAPLAHAGHPEAVASALFSALATPDVPRTHAVAGNASQGYQLLSVYPG